MVDNQKDELQTRIQVKKVWWAKLRMATSATESVRAFAV